MIYQNKQLNDELHSYLNYQFKVFIRPQYFIVLEWLPFAKDHIIARKNARHFRNVLLGKLHNYRYNRLPENHTKLAFFHERTTAIINPRNHKNPIYKEVFHTNLYVGNLPHPYSELSMLERLIKEEVTPLCKNLSKANSRFNKGVVILDYNEERHKFYSLKDINKFKYKQDNELVPDYEHSDYSAPLSEWKTRRLTPEQIAKNKEYALTRNRNINFPVLQ